MTIIERKMAKLVGVVHDSGDDSNQSSSSKCLARRQLPLTIENDLTMIMALDDACLACCSLTLIDTDEETHNEIKANQDTFLRKFEALNRDEVTAALMCSFKDIEDTLAKEVSCVGCRRSVESMLNKLLVSGDPALEPLVITEDKAISIGRDHIKTPQALANLFCSQLHRLKTTYIDASSGSKNRKKGNNVRCNAHSLVMGSKKLLHFGHWTSTWKCMERECQEECVLIHFDLLRDTIDKYLKKHSFCDECTKMVNKAYTMLVEDEDVPTVVPGGCCNAPVTSTDASEDKQVKKIYNGLTSCVSDHHVHVECNEEVVSHLIEMAEPELSGLRQERHAKTIEIAQKEVLTCIGICLYERFQRIQQRLREGQQACDLLFYVALQSLKFSFEMAFESKMGNSEVDKLLAGFAESDRQEELKAQKKREKKKKQKQKKDQAVASINDFSADVSADLTSAVTGSAGSSPPALNSCPFQSNAGQRAANGCSKSETAVVDVSLPAKDCVSADNCKQIAAVVQKHCPAPPSSQLTVLKKLERKTCRTNGAFNQGALIIPNNGPMIDWRRLEKMLDANDPGEINDYEEDDDEIHQDEINEYLNKVQEQRAELRNNLRQKFEQLCANGR